MIRAVLGWIAYASGVAVGQFLDGFAAGRAAVREARRQPDDSTSTAWWPPRV